MTTQIDLFTPSKTHLIDRMQQLGVQSNDPERIKYGEISRQLTALRLRGQEQQRQELARLGAEYMNAPEWIRLHCQSTTTHAQR